MLNIHWKDCCWNWNSSTLATWCEELTHWKRPWCWERLKAGGEGDGDRWDSWIISPTQWTWVWVNSGSWWRTGRPGVRQSIVSQTVGHNWVTELNWTKSRTIFLRKNTINCILINSKSKVILHLIFYSFEILTNNEKFTLCQEFAYKWWENQVKL